MMLLSDSDNLDNTDDIETTRVSIAVGREIKSAVRRKQQAISMTKGDECVCSSIKTT